jgi:hypothetical protein
VTFAIGAGVTGITGAFVQEEQLSLDSGLTPLQLAGEGASLMSGARQYTSRVRVPLKPSAQLHWLHAEYAYRYSTTGAGVAEMAGVAGAGFVVVVHAGISHAWALAGFEPWQFWSATVNPAED